jgi:hypothetical protein
MSRYWLAAHLSDTQMTILTTAMTARANKIVFTECSYTAAASELSVRPDIASFVGQQNRLPYGLQECYPTKHRSYIPFVELRVSDHGPLRPVEDME